MANRGDLIGESGKVAVTFRLNRFLQNVQMENQRVGADHRHGAAAVIEAVAVIQLHCAQIAEQENIRGHVSHLK